MKSPVSWVGNKTPLLPYINAILPENCERFVDVFGGSGTVLLGRRPCSFEVYNDYDSDLVNLFRCMKDRTIAFIKELGLFPLNSRADFLFLKEALSKNEFKNEWINEEIDLTSVILSPPGTEDIKRLLTERANDYDIKRAVAFYKVIRFSYSSGLKSFASQPIDLRRFFNSIWELHGRMTNVIIENQDFETLIRHYDRPNTVFYCDPPYYETEGMYAACFSKDDHERLKNTLCSIKGRFLLSYNDCEYIRKLYRDFEILECSRIHNMAQRYNAGAEFPELLIGNFDLLETQKNKPIQLVIGEDNENIDYEKILRESIVKNKIKK
ncbi:MAG: DNA adenine methylase [Clostridia bacterium]|nr:DNA adenine methylase [Clostridia bacterium]